MSARRVLTVEEAAEQLRLTPYTVRKFLRLRKLKGVKTSPGRGGEWRVPETAVAEYLSSQNYPPAEMPPGIETAILSEQALRKEWLTPEEDEYWAHL